MELHDPIRVWLNLIASELFSPGSILSIYSLAATFGVAVCALAYRHKSRRGHPGFATIWRAIFGTPLWRHASFWADVKLVILSVVVLPPLMVTLAISSNTVAMAVRSLLNTAFGPMGSIDGHDSLIRAASTIVLFIAYETGYWVDHYLKHRVPFLWEFHKLHHTAEVLTPLTNYRNHPVDNVVFGYMLSMFIGCASGILAWILGRDTEIVSVDGKNIIFIFFLWTIGHLQHSQFWIPFRGLWGLIIMSPAHHQIHHSDDPKHFNRNLGSVLAIWDWMFGTLEIPSAQNPRLSYGVKEAGQDAHSWVGMLVTPLVGGGVALTRALVPARNSLLSAGSRLTDRLGPRPQDPGRKGY